MQKERRVYESVKSIWNAAAALAIANLVPEDEVSDVNILPEAFDERVADVVSQAVKDHITR